MKEENDIIIEPEMDVDDEGNTYWVLVIEGGDYETESYIK